jgi:hypothetical protein
VGPISSPAIAILNTILGSDRFQEEIARGLGRRVQPAKPGRPRQTAEASHAEQIM